MSQSKAAPVKMTAAERKLRAVELRKLGFTYQKIGDQLGVSVSAAHKMVMTALRELNEKTSEGADELRRLELERLDEWLLRIAQEIKGGNVLPAIDRGIRLLDRRSKLLGLDLEVGTWQRPWVGREMTVEDLVAMITDSEPPEANSG